MNQKSTPTTELASSVERRIPKLMVRPPEKTLASPINVIRRVPQGQRTTVAFTNEVEGQCPVCHQPMKTSVANGIDVYVCMDHRVVMPLKNEGGV
jgi:hypothetical protein